jgi:hypothetical protein
MRRWDWRLWQQAATLWSHDLSGTGCLGHRGILCNLRSLLQGTAEDSVVHWVQVPYLPMFAHFHLALGSPYWVSQSVVISLSVNHTAQGYQCPDSSRKENVVPKCQSWTVARASALYRCSRSWQQKCPLATFGRWQDLGLLMVATAGVWSCCPRWRHPKLLPSTPALPSSLPPWMASCLADSRPRSSEG